MSLHREKESKVWTKEIVQKKSNNVMENTIPSYSNIGFRHFFLTAISYTIPICLCLEHLTKNKIAAR